MAQYTIEIRVTARREPDPLPEIPELHPALQDPQERLLKTAEKMMNSGAFHLQSQSTSSLGLEKTISLRAESFAQLAAIIANFNELAERMEMESQAAE